MVECALCELARLVGGDTPTTYSSGSTFCTAASNASFRESDRDSSDARASVPSLESHARHPTPQRGRGAKTKSGSAKKHTKFFFSLCQAIILTLPEADRRRGWSREVVGLIIRQPKASLEGWIL